MAVGDIYRAGVGDQSTAGDFNLNETAITKCEFQSELETAGIYSMAGNNQDLTVSEAGHYLIGWSFRGVATANTRQQFRGVILINSSELTGAYGTQNAYSRNNANERTSPTGMAIVDLSASDIISIGTIRTATDTTSILQEDSQGGFWVVKLSDTAAYARIRGGNSQTLSATNLTYADLQIATNDELDTGFTHSTNSADITLADAGLYFVCYGFQATNQSGTRLEFISRLTLDGVIQHQSWAARNSRFDGGTETQQICGFALIRASASDILRISAANEFLDTGTVSDIDNVWITILKLESDIDVLLQTLTGGAQEANPASATVIDYDAPAEIDSGTFAEAAGRVTVAKIGHYLLTSTIHNVRQDTDATRAVQRTRARLNTTNDVISGGGSYNRGNQGADDNFNNVSTTQFLTPDLSVNDIIDVTLQQDGDTIAGSLDIVEGGQTCFRIEDLIQAAGSGNFDQDIFRARNDDGNETTATFKVAANTDWIQAVDENLRIRFNISEDDDVEDLDQAFKLQYNKNAGGWNDVNAASTNVRSSASPNVTDGVDTTEQLSGPGTFVTPNSGFDEVDGEVGGTALDFSTTLNEEVELEFCVQVRSADTSSGDTIQLRVVEASGTLLTTYTQTPTLTVETWEIDGITRDKDGSVLANCRVVLFKRDNVAEGSRIYTIQAHTTSNGSGVFTFAGLTDNDALYMLFAYDDVAVDVRGVTDDFLTPTSEGQ